MICSAADFEFLGSGLLNILVCFGGELGGSRKRKEVAGVEIGVVDWGFKCHDEGVARYARHAAKAML